MSSNLYVQDGAGIYRLATTNEVFATARARVNKRHRRGALLTSNTDTDRFLFPKLANLSHEVFGVIYLDSRHRIIEYVQHFTGTINCCTVHPRIILKHALDVNASSLICSHNHPSGSSEPPQTDIKLTNRIKEFLIQIEVRLVDHVAISSDDSVSMASRGLL